VTILPKPYFNLVNFIDEDAQEMVSISDVHGKIHSYPKLMFKTDSSELPVVKLRDVNGEPVSIPELFFRIPQIFGESEEGKEKQLSGSLVVCNESGASVKILKKFVSPVPRFSLPDADGHVVQIPKSLFTIPPPGIFPEVFQNFTIIPDVAGNLLPVPNSVFCSDVRWANLVDAKGHAVGILRKKFGASTELSYFVTMKEATGGSISLPRSALQKFESDIPPSQIFWDVDGKYYSASPSDLSEAENFYDSYGNLFSLPSKFFDIRASTHVPLVSVDGHIIDVPRSMFKVDSPVPPARKPSDRRLFSHSTPAITPPVSVRRKSGTSVGKGVEAKPAPPKKFLATEPVSSPSMVGEGGAEVRQVQSANGNLVSLLRDKCQVRGEDEATPEAEFLDSEGNIFSLKLLEGTLYSF
jgi:hypothetical protein